jgi:hypothetical protein
VVWPTSSSCSSGTCQTCGRTWYTKACADLLHIRLRGLCPWRNNSRSSSQSRVHNPRRDGRASRDQEKPPRFATGPLPTSQTALSRLVSLQCPRRLDTWLSRMPTDEKLRGNFSALDNTLFSCITQNIQTHSTHKHKHDMFWMKKGNMHTHTRSTN